jgi:hypothetical protein
MHGLKRHLGVAVALACSLAVMTGTELAAPPSTPPGQEQSADVAATPPGQSEQAPGQEQKAAAQADGAAQAPGQEKKAANAVVASATEAQGINSTSAGVKPSSDTDKHTSCITGGSMPSPTCTRTPPGDNPPDSSKRYGNGTTAAQIAVGRGADEIEIRGPGNSQPHKVCAKNGNWVDVHAVKSYVGVCAGVTTTRPTTSVTPTTTNVISPTAAVTPTAPGAAAGAAVGAGGVAGVQGGLGSSERPAAAGGAGGVQGAFGVLGASGTLPFTGFPLWAVVLLGLASVAIGLSFRHHDRLTTRDLV